MSVTAKDMAQHGTADSADGLGAECKRCGRRSELTVLRGESLCKYVHLYFPPRASILAIGSHLPASDWWLIFRSDCFQKYIHMKIVKRMEGFRVRHISDISKRRLLLPYFGTLSSATLLHVLDGYLQLQRERTGRTGFVLHILVIKDENFKFGQKHYDSVKSIYRDHQFSEVSLGDLLSAKPFTHRVKEFAVDRYLSGNLPPTARADLRSLLERLAVIDYATKDGCECVLWSHSTTELARLILSETAKGNGAFAGQLIADGGSPYAVNFHYPMRDLLDTELKLFLKMTCLQEELVDIDSVGRSTIEKIPDSTIENIMLNYCTSTEMTYPNILANVVRTCGKLEAASDSKLAKRCTLCTALTGTTPCQYPRNPSGVSNGDPKFQAVDLCCGCAKIIADISDRPNV